MGSRLVLRPMPSTRVTLVWFYLWDNILPINASAPCIAPNLRMRFTVLLASRSFALCTVWYGVYSAKQAKTRQPRSSTGSLLLKLLTTQGCCNTTILRRASLNHTRNVASCSRDAWSFFRKFSYASASWVSRSAQARNESFENGGLRNDFLLFFAAILFSRWSSASTRWNIVS